MARTSIRNSKTEDISRRAQAMPKRGERSRELEDADTRALPEHMAPGGEMAPAGWREESERLGEPLPGSRGLPPQGMQTSPEEIDRLPRAEERQPSSGWGLILVLALIAIGAALIIYGIRY